MPPVTPVRKQFLLVASAMFFALGVNGYLLSQAALTPYPFFIYSSLVLPVFLFVTIRIQNENKSVAALAGKIFRVGILAYIAYLLCHAFAALFEYPDYFLSLNTAHFLTNITIVTLLFLAVQANREIFNIMPSWPEKKIKNIFAFIVRKKRIFIMIAAIAVALLVDVDYYDLAEKAKLEASLYQHLDDKTLGALSDKIEVDRSVKSVFVDSILVGGVALMLLYQPKLGKFGKKKENVV